MGWWAYNIMAGDIPLDVQGEMFDAIDVNTIEATGELPPLPVIKEALESGGAQKIVDLIASGALSDYPQATVAQVAAHFHMECGASMPDSIRAAALDGCDNDPNFAWADHAVRRAYVQHFKDAIIAYDGTPFQDPPRGAIEERYAVHKRHTCVEIAAH
jgi:hypothetical protein